MIKAIDEVTQEISYNGCVALIGKIIRIAIEDYHAYLRKKDDELWMKQNHVDVESTKHYLFSPDGLEDQILRLGLNININFVRKVALDSDSKYCRNLGLL